MATPSSSSSSSQYTQQFLSSVLSQSGSAGLPYTEDSKWLIRQHLLALSESFPALHPQTTSYTHNDGRTVHLLQSYGTIPMLFQNVTYNIPVIIWLMESYPRHPPLVRVNPTPDMIIKRPHSFVNPDGMVSIPYLQNWVYPSSNLLDLARNLSHYFGRDPPLYSQRRPPPSPTTPSSLTPPPSSDSFSNANTRPAIPPGTYPASPYGSSTGNRVSEDAGEVFRRNAIHKLVESLSGDVGAMRKIKEGEMEGLFGVQGVLRQRAEVVGNGVREMQEEKEGLEMQLQIVVINSDVLGGWLRENDGKEKRDGRVDEAFEAVDGLSKQMLECTVADLAVEDVVYALDKAVQDGAVPFDQYLRSVRSLAREQFFHRATGFKVRGAQMQAHVSSMAARVSHYPS